MTWAKVDWRDWKGKKWTCHSVTPSAEAALADSINGGREADKKKTRASRGQAEPEDKAFGGDQSSNSIPSMTHPFDDERELN